MITYGSTTLTSYNSIVKTEVYYYKSTSATSLSGGSWATTKPTWENGKYIWQKIRTVYEDGTHTESDPVNITGQQGATGTAAYSYKLNSSDSIIGKTKDGEYTIKKITFSATYKQGTGAVSAYGGRFKIESTTNGSTWKTEYTSSGNESSKEFTIPDDIILIKCSLYQSDGTTVLLDIVTVPVVKDGVDAIGLRDSIPYYLASDKDTGITRLTQGWTRYRPQLTAEKKYLWVYYVSRYSEGSTEPELIEIKDDSVHFVNNGDESSVESCVVDIEPVQDLHGYDHPWPAGGGANLLPFEAVLEEGWTNTLNGITATYSKGVMRVTGTSTSTNWTNIVELRNVWNHNPVLLGHGDYVMADNLIITLAVDGGSFTNKSTAFTAGESVSVRGFYIAVAAGRTVDWTIPMMFIRGTNRPTSYEPYSNICPITGWTGVEINKYGKNLLSVNTIEDVSWAYDLIATRTAEHNISKIINSLDVGTYTISYTATVTSVNTQKYTSTTAKAGMGSMTIITSNGDRFSNYRVEIDLEQALNHYSITNDLTINVTANNKGKFTHCYIYGLGRDTATEGAPNGTLGLGEYSNLQLELGSTATEYEPYQGTTYDIAFPSESDTVYGGQLNVTTGELTVDRAMVRISDLSWTYSSNYKYMYTDSIKPVIARPDSNTTILDGLLCSAYKTASAQQAGSGNVNLTCACEISGAIRVKDNSYTDVDTWLAVAGNETIVYPLATPTTYHLTPQEITMLCKENNIFADTGQTAISYYDNQTSTDPYVDYSATSAFEYSVKAYEATQPLYTKTYTGIIGTANTFADASFYFAKIHPTTYTSNYKVKMKIRVTAPVDYAETIDIQLGGYGSSFSSYDSYTTRTGSIGIYYVNLYRATQAGIETNKKGHAIGFGLRSSTNPTNTSYKRDITVDILELDGCTIEMLDTPVKYADMDGTGSTNYTAYNELAVASAGQNATNNTNTHYTQYNNSVKAGTFGVKRYTLLMRDTQDTWVSFVNQANTVATTKTVSTNGHILGKLIYSAGGAEYASGTNTSTVYDAYPFDFRYSSNCGTTLTTDKPIYLVGTVKADGLFYFDTTTWWTQTEPTSVDNRVYIYVGMAYSNYQVWLNTENPAYQFYDGEFLSYDKVVTLKSISDLKETLEDQIDGKVETWCQSTDPSTAWTTTDLKNQHDGDLWYYTGESTSSYKNNTTYKYTASTNKWTAYSANTDLFDKIDNKTAIYYGEPTTVTSAEEGDYLVDATDGSSYRWNSGAWVKVSDYKSAIDAIEIGGRNLLKWTTKPKANGTYYKKNPEETDGWYAWNSSIGAITETDNGIKFTHNSSTTSAGIVIPLVSLNAVIGEIEYVLSFKYRTNLTSIGSPYLLCQAGENISYGQAISIIQSETEWKYFNYKIQWSSSSGKNTWAILIPYINTSNGWIEIQNSSMKLEKGNKPTDWTPAPEDTEAEISALQEDLQSQIDEKIQTYYQSTNPASAWTTADIRATHDGDLWCYTGTTTSTYTKDNVYRYNASNNTWTTYSASGDLFDKVDGKTTVFYGKTTDTFTDVETGDYLVDATDGSSYRYDGSKWVKVTDYQAAIDNIEVGGRNLARNTQGAIIDKIGAAEGSRAEYAAFDLGCALPLNDNDNISISFDLYMVVRTANPMLNVYNTNNQGVHQTCIITNVLSGNSYQVGDVIDKRVAFVSTIHDRESSTLPHDYLEFYSTYGTNNFFRISNLKVEKGNKPTAWTPAPEDIDSSINAAQSTADEALAATQPISSKTFTDIIGTANDIANASFYFAKVHPTTYTDPWMVKMKIKASVPSDTNFRKTVDITIHGCRSNFISYDSIVANYNSNPIYYLNLYRATQAGIETNKKGHALGFGLRSATSPTDTNKKRTFEVDLLEVDGCTVDWIDTPVKYADMDGTGSTNYVGCTELGITSNGQNATNNGNTYDRVKYSTIKAAEDIARYNIIVGTSAGYKHLKSGTPWDITYPILYADAALNANATGSSNYLTIPFTVTTTQNMTLTPYKPVYIEGTLEGTTFTPIDTTPLTQTVPTSDNGHQYILLGSAYSTTAINLEAEHPIYQFQNGNFVTVAEAASRIGANAENLLKATYAVCSTAAGTNAKTADCTNFELYEGARIQVTFTNANTASAPTLNINNTGAKAIYINKTAASNTNQLLWTAGSKMEFVYDGTGWVAQNVPYALYGTCSTGASTAAKAVTCNEAVICKGTTISVNMTNTNTAANATMNVGSTAAKDIYANGAKLTTNSRFNWRANTTQKFVFDGQVWRMDDDSVKALATAYITEIDDDGIMVHPEDDSTSGWAISDAIQLFKHGISYIKLWIENNIPKIRIGKEDQGHIILDNDSVDVRDGDDVLATFGENTRIGTENGTYLSLSSEGLIGSKNNLQYMQFLANGKSQTYGHVTSFSGGYGDSPQTYTHHISINESIENYIIFNFKADENYYSFVQQLEIKDSEETYTFVDRTSRYQVTTRFISNSKDMTCYQTLTRLNSQAPKVRCTFRYIVTKQKQSPTFTLGTRVENSDQGLWSYSEGLNNIASGDFSYVEGENNTASGSYAHAEGKNVTASGLYSHAGGDSTTSDWAYTFVHGRHLISNDEAQAVFGTYNKRYGYDRRGYLFILGNGTDDDDYYRSDAFIVDYTGNVFLDIDDSASSGTTDAKLYDAITALGWQNDIINNM